MTEKRNWPADKVFRRKVADLAPDARNARTHSDDQVAEIAASITKWGWTVPVLVDEKGTLIAGHGRVLAAERLGIDRIPTCVAKGWPEEEIRAYAIADNKLALNAEWDDELLGIELGHLEQSGFDLPLVGFNDAEIAALLSNGDATDAFAEWEDMPEFEHEDKTAFRSITCHFHDQKAVDDFAKRNEKSVTDATRMIWFPEIEIEAYIDKRYADEKPKAKRRRKAK